jgi:hypothetical protein
VLSDRLVGTFRLVALETHRSDGTVDRPMGDEPEGQFMFDRDGNYSVQLTAGGATGGGASGFPATVAMWGTYTVDDERQTFTLTPRGALDRAVIGAAIVRHVEFGNDVAVFTTPPLTVDGVEAVTTITWRLVAPSDRGAVS